MDKRTEATMIENLYKNTGKPIEQWLEIAHQHRDRKHQEVVAFFKLNYDLTTFYADLIVHKANGTDAGSSSFEELMHKQYKGKEHLMTIYKCLMEHVETLGTDIEVAPKNAYVSLRRKKQFACLKPATKTRFELELIIKGQEASGILEKISGVGAMCTHKINLASEDQITEEVINWVRVAYTKAI